MIVRYQYDCGCEMARFSGDKINDVRIGCKYHRELLVKEIEDLAAKLSLLLHKSQLKHQ